MNKKEIGRLSDDQALAILDLKPFVQDHEKIKDILLNRNGLSADIFRELHTKAGCKTISEFTYAHYLGRSRIHGKEIGINNYVRKCETHNVESREFAEFGVAPDDWDGITESRRVDK